MRGALGSTTGFSLENFGADFKDEGLSAVLRQWSETALSPESARNDFALSTRENFDPPALGPCFDLASAALQNVLDTCVEAPVKII